MRKKKSGFTLIEVLVAVAIFVIVFMITMAFVTLAAGRVKSDRTKMLTGEVRNAMNLINQSLANSNASKETGDPRTRFHGFRVFTGPLDPIPENPVLGVSSQRVQGGEVCTYFTRIGNQIKELTTNNCSQIYPNRDASWQDVTSNKVKITNLSFAPNDFLRTEKDRIDPTDTVPFITITIEAQDADPKYENENKIHLRNAYTMDYQTYKNIICQGISDPGHPGNCGTIFTE